MLAISPEKKHAVNFATARARVVQTLAEFKAMLGPDGIGGLPVSLQGEPLAVLGQRMCELFCEDEQRAAAAAFSEAARNFTGRRSALLDEMQQLASDPKAIRERAWAAAESRADVCAGPGRAAVESGVKVQVVAQQLGFRFGSPEFIRLQSFAAHGPGLDAVRRGEAVPDVLQRLGISHPDLVHGLEQAAATGGEGGRVLARRPPDVPLNDSEIGDLYRNVYAGEPRQADFMAGHGAFVAEIHALLMQQGFLKPKVQGKGHPVPYWEFLAMSQALSTPPQAESLIELGLQILQIPFAGDSRYLASDEFLSAVRKHEGPMPSLLKELAEAACADCDGTSLAARAESLCAGPGRVAVERGANTRAVARRLGISGPENFAKLEKFAVNGPGRAAVENGDNVMAVARRLGISERALVNELKRIAVDGPGRAAVEAGEEVQVVAQRLGVLETSHVLELERVAVDGPGRAAVEAGENVQAIAQRLGIFERSNVLALERFA